MEARRELSYHLGYGCSVNHDVHAIKFDRFVNSRELMGDRVGPRQCSMCYVLNVGGELSAFLSPSQRLNSYIYWLIDALKINIRYRFIASHVAICIKFTIQSTFCLSFCGISKCGYNCR